MTGLVNQIQAEAIDTSVSVSNLLRKVRLAAAKLQLDEAVDWVERELNGYESGRDVPDYRILHGGLFAHSRFHGQIPLSGDPETIMSLGTQHICESVASLEALAEDKDGGTLMIKLDERVTHRIHEANCGPRDPIYVHLSPGAVVSIIDRVRNMILDWAVGLEKQGITGEGVNFSVSEKEKAAAVGQTITIGTLYGGLANAHVTGDGNKTEASVTDQSVTTNNSLFADLSTAIEAKVKDTADREAMLALVEQLKHQQGKAGFKLPFAALLEYTANYATILTPFLPALANLAPG